MIQTIKRRFAVMKIDKSNTSYKLASDVAEIIKTQRITPHNVIKVSPFEMHMGRKPNTPLSNMHDLRRWSEDKVQIQKKGSPPKVTQKSLPRTLTNTHSPTQPETGAYSKPIELAKNNFIIRYKGVQRTIDKNTEKRIEQVARKTIRLATKLKNSKSLNKNIRP